MNRIGIWIWIGNGIESACQCRRGKRHGFNPWVDKIPWRRKWQPAPVFLPEESHGERGLVGYSPWRQTWLSIAQHQACLQIHDSPAPTSAEVKSLYIYAYVSLYLCLYSLCLCHLYLSPHPHSSPCRYPHPYLSCWLLFIWWWWFSC